MPRWMLKEEDGTDAARRDQQVADGNARSLSDQVEHLRATLDSIADAVVCSNANGTITSFNPAAERITGWSRAAAVGQPPDKVLHIINGITREVLENPMALALHAGLTVNLATNSVLIRLDGAEVPIEDCCSPICGRHGEVTGAVMVFRDVTATRALALKMSHMAQHDSLTGLPNRVLLNDRLTQAIALARRHGTRLAVLFLDLDHFKRVNDTLGHGIGDRLLQAVAHRLLTCIRGSDTVSRQGGDEFVVLLSETAHTRDPAIIAEKILGALRIPSRIDGHSLRVSASIGIATYPAAGTDARTLLEHADMALLHAKSSGRGNHQLFAPDMSTWAAAKRDRQSCE